MDLNTILPENRHAAMALALQMANRAGMATSPNPKVGCVLIKDGLRIGQGWTQPVGQAHAEVQAIRDAQQNGYVTAGATAYVTLEPCSHFGRTPPCANALIDAGVARVVALMQDPNPLVAGRGLAMLREAGIATDLFDLENPEDALLIRQAQELNIGFFKRMQTGLPWVRMKLAASLDGRTALPNGHSQWITEAQARQDGHGWRARADAIITGIGTVLADDPMMNVRGVGISAEANANVGIDIVAGTTFQPKKIVLDSALRTPLNAKILQGGGVTLVCAQPDSEKLEQFAKLGVEVLCLPDLSDAKASKRVSLPELLRELGRRQFNEVHIEAGAQLNGALLEQGCVDELLLYLAPKILGSGAGLFAFPELQSVDQAKLLRFHEVEQIAETLRIRARLN